MLRVSILYPATPDAVFDFEYYRTRHAPLVLSRLGAHGVDRYELDRGVSNGASTRAPYVAVAHFYASDLAHFQAGLAAHGAELLADVPRFTNVSPTLQISETFPLPS